jgi:hypothetical protein
MHSAALDRLTPSGPFASAHRMLATKMLVFSGWRVVPGTIAALPGYDAERGERRAARPVRLKRAPVPSGRSVDELERFRLALPSLERPDLNLNRKAGQVGARPLREIRTHL